MNTEELFPEHKEHHPARQVLFQALGGILKRFEHIIRRNIDHTLDIERYNMAIPDLPEHLAGTKIVHISDMHFHENWEPENMRKALIDKLRTIKNESQGKKVICVFTGDMLSKHTNFSVVEPQIIYFMNSFRQIFGTRAALHTCEGNHDVYRKNWQTEKMVFQQLGIDYAGQWNEGGIQIITTPDFTCDRTGAEKTLQMGLDREPQGAFLRLILSHNLDVLRNVRLPESTFPQIVMGGHTHNGHLGLVNDQSFSNTSDLLRRAMAYILLGNRTPLVAGVARKGSNFFTSISPGVGENENRPRFNSPRGLPVFTLVSK